MKVIENLYTKPQTLNKETSNEIITDGDTVHFSKL
jgi:hypothetical protein